LLSPYIGCILHIVLISNGFPLFYLVSNHLQRIVINEAQSSQLPVVFGVPQGTILGPLLFLLYINDINKDILSYIHLFADLCILYHLIKSQSDCTALQADIDRLHSWATTWQMQFNSSKCHILDISRQFVFLLPWYRHVAINIDDLVQPSSF